MARQEYTYYDINQIGEMEPSKLCQMVKENYEVARDFQEPMRDRNKEIYAMYNGKIDKPEEDWRHNIFIPIIYSTIETMVPREVEIILNSSPYGAFRLIPSKGTPTQNALNHQDMLVYQLDQMEFPIKCISWFKEGAMYGHSVRKLAFRKEYKTVPQMKKFMVQKPKRTVFGMTIQTEEVPEWSLDNTREAKFIGPDLIEVDIDDGFFKDPLGNSIEEAGYCMHRAVKDYAYLYQLLESDDIEGYDKAVIREIIADKSEWSRTDDFLRERFAEADFTYDPRRAAEQHGKRPLVEVKEYWTNMWILTVVNDKYLIRKVQNPYYCKMFVDIRDIILPSEYFGQPAVYPIIPINYAMNDMLNMHLDSIEMTINPMLKVGRDGNVDLDTIVSQPGGIILADDINQVQQLVYQDYSGRSIEQVFSLLSRFRQETTGMSDYNMGISSSPQLNRTATGISIITEQANARLKLKMGQYRLGLKKMFEYMIQMNNLFLPAEENIQIIPRDAEMIKELNRDDYTGKFFVRVSTASQEVNQDIIREQALFITNKLENDPMVNHDELRAVMPLAFPGVLDWSKIFRKSGELASFGITPDMEKTLSSQTLMEIVTQNVATQMAQNQAPPAGAGGGGEAAPPAGMPEDSAQQQAIQNAMDIVNPEVNAGAGTEAVIAR